MYINDRERRISSRHISRTTRRRYSRYESTTTTHFSFSSSFYVNWTYGRKTFMYNETLDTPVKIEANNTSREGKPLLPEEENELGKLITIKRVDFNKIRNTFDHHTSEYSFKNGVQHLAVRRGQDFDITVHFDRRYDQKQDDLKIVFEIGECPLRSKDTRVSMILSDKDLLNEWGAKIVKQEDTKTTVKIFTPPTCFVGEWSLSLEGISLSSKSPLVKTYKCPNSIFILFNPWCKADQVYHEDGDMLKEYVLNDTGRIYVGDAKDNIHGRPWVFGQFESGILECVLNVLNRAKFRVYARGDPVKVVRRISALINANDDNGVLIGNWSGDYNDGTTPSYWTGSTAILEQYDATQQSVPYGQCWVFSGVFTTCLRALGIPARSVTNFGSAHDTDGSMTFDKYFDRNGEPLDEMNSDSIWNYHVWNEAWMARPELEEDYGGWQACDATPQEESDGIFQCGPCPVLAIKRGEVNVPFDAAFLFAEVNADEVYWQIKDAEPEMIIIKPNVVGFCISTNRPAHVDSNEEVILRKPFSDRWREDITSQYKFEEGSAAERAAVMKANLAGSKPRLYDQPTSKQADVEFKIIRQKQMKFGDDCCVEVEMKNTSSEERHVRGTMSLRSFYTTGVFASKVMSQKVNVTLKKDECCVSTIKVSFIEYDPYTVEECNFKTSAMLMVEETNQIFNADEPFRMLKPDLTIKPTQELKVGQKALVEVSFKNPLPILLSTLVLQVEAPGVQKPWSVPDLPVYINPQEYFTTSFEMSPEKVKKCNLVAVFGSKQLGTISGECEINIKAA